MPYNERYHGQFTLHTFTFGLDIFAGLGNSDVQRRTLLVTTGSNERANEKLTANELKRRGSVSPDNETTTTASGTHRSSVVSFSKSIIKGEINKASIPLVF